jgi:hypothetical protein
MNTDFLKVAETNEIQTSQMKLVVVGDENIRVL